jgi:hypothetical protein
MRENLTVKASRLLVDNRVFVKWCMPDHVCAAVRDTGVSDTTVKRARGDLAIRGRRVMDWLDGLPDDEPILGGCDRCDAYQVMTPDPVHAGIFHLAIHHDDDCPFLRARAAGSN